MSRVLAFLALACLLAAPWLAPGVVAGGALALNGVVLVLAAAWVYIEAA